MGEKQKKNKTDELVNDIIATYEGDSGANFIDVTNLPVREKILDVLDSIMEILFPGYTGKRVSETWVPEWGAYSRKKLIKMSQRRIIKYLEAGSVLKNLLSNPSKRKGRKVKFRRYGDIK